METDQGMPVEAVKGQSFPDGQRLLFGVGAQKAGTSWLYQFLDQSPQVHFSKLKEVHYFDVHFGHEASPRNRQTRRKVELEAQIAEQNHPASPDQSRRLRHLNAVYDMYNDPEKHGFVHSSYQSFMMDGSSGQEVIADISPSYCMLTRDQFAEMASLGDAKFVYLMRDPVARMWSAVRMNVRRHMDGDSAEELERRSIARARGFKDGLHKWGTRRSNYVRTVAELDAAIAPENLYYGFYEDLFDGQVPLDICDLLGIDAPHVNSDERVHAGLQVDMPQDVLEIMMDVMRAQYEGIRERFGDRVPNSWLG